MYDDPLALVKLGRQSNLQLTIDTWEINSGVCNTLKDGHHSGKDIRLKDGHRSGKDARVKDGHRGRG